MQSITFELYNKLVPDYPIQENSGEWDDILKYVTDIDYEMKRKAWGLGDCHHYYLSLYYKDYLDYGPLSTPEMNVTRGLYLKRAIDTFTNELYSLKIIG